MSQSLFNELAMSEVYNKFFLGAYFRRLRRPPWTSSGPFVWALQREIISTSYHLVELENMTRKESYGLTVGKYKPILTVFVGISRLAQKDLWEMLLSASKKM